LHYEFEDHEPGRPGLIRHTVSRFDLEVLQRRRSTPAVMTNHLPLCSRINNGRHPGCLWGEDPLEKIPVQRPIHWSDGFERSRRSFSERTKNAASQNMREEKYLLLLLYFLPKVMRCFSSLPNSRIRFMPAT
jgi:hypothetical protein